MLSISCDHPDLEEFIEVKSDLEKVTKANISIRITDEFMKAVREKEKYTLSFTREETGEVIQKEIDAHEFFRKMCEMNWGYAEPGMLFWDRIENYNLLSNDNSFKYSGVNPCFAGNMHLLTTDGYKTFEELCDTEPYIYNANGNITKSRVWCSGVKDTVCVRLSNHESIVCTPDHRFMTLEGDECMAKDLKGKHLMPMTKVNKTFDEFFVKCGFIQGDGCLGRLNSEYHDGLEVNIGVRDTDIYDLFSNESYTVASERAIYLNGFNDKLEELGFSHEQLPHRLFPETYDSWTYHQKASFLHGCYSANGSVIKKGRVAYKTTCREFAEQLKQTLTNDFGIDGVYITTNKAKPVQFSNGEYICRESYDVNICRYKEITKFISEINFYQQYKREHLEIMMKSKALSVTSVAPYRKMKVYDFTEPERHWGVVEGNIVHNCAEEPLPAGGSCLLGSINLSAFVTNNRFDFESFKETVRIATIALNEVLDEGLPLHPLEEQRKSVADWRQIGCGIFGLADMLIKLGITYGSKEAIDLCSNIGSVMADTALRTSAELARELGAYPKFNPEAILSSDFLLSNTTKETQAAIKEYGLRNSQLLTIAPTGSLSSMLGVSGGIEPIYANYYERKTESLHDHDEYYKVYTPIVKEYMDYYELKDDADLPEYFVTAQTLNYKDRISMQAVWQKHIDASISSTVNVPNGFTVEEVEDLYMLAWKKGLKGVTIYRDGCSRSGILSTGTHDDKKELILQSDDALPRGYIIKSTDDLLGVSREIQTGCADMMIHLNFDEDTAQPYQTYIDLGDGGGCERNIEFISRLISTCLRGGIPLSEVIKQGKKVRACDAYCARKYKGGDVSKGRCCPSAIAFALEDLQKKIEAGYMDVDDVVDEPKKHHIKKPSHVAEEKHICPDCGAELVAAGGCFVCVCCPYNKCE